MSHRVLRLVSSLLLALCCGCGPRDLVAPPEVEQSRGEIRGGTLAPNEAEVFLLLTTPSNAAPNTAEVCSATLIGERTLLTAAHCVDVRNYAGATTLKVKASNKPSLAATAATDWISVTEARLHPAWDPQALHDDIALVLLKTAPVPALKPRAWNSASLVGFEGKAIRAVGYGKSAETLADPGTKRSVNMAIAIIDPTVVFRSDMAGRGVCGGDSGGPTFHTFEDGVERVIGVHSYEVIGSNCTRGGDTRVDSYAPFIDEWMAQFEPVSCPDDGICACTQPARDLDCSRCGADGVCTWGCAVADPDCQPDGASCSSAATCAGSRCSAGGYCSRACSASAECSGGMSCVGGECQRPVVTVEPVPPELPANQGRGCAQVPGLPVVALLAAVWLGRRRR